MSKCEEIVIEMKNFIQTYNLMQEEFATLMHTTPATISRWIHGKRKPSSEYVLRFIELRENYEKYKNILK